ncbi:efflux RND transporter periplasmic adaptor subunit [Halobacillus salinus]|uniref:efflux RND transporter periplasmic adaptor subunit n=1 Tax=Halobacillus salinus TaxID=192814 RepID=UPI0009A7508D|nr:efflux RND transporter periplasmic adaptor subunit [Halobacillus salinus]
MKRFVALILLMTVVACSNQEAAEDKEPRVTPVETAEISRGDFIVEREIVGRATTAETSQVISETPGELVSLKFEKGDRVEKGDTIGVVDPGSGEDQIELQQLAVRQAEKQLENARISKQQAALGVENAEEQVELANKASNAEQSQTSQAVKAAKQQYEQAQELANQTQQLVEEGVVPESLAVQAQNRADQAHAQVQQLQGQQPQSSSAVAQAEAQVDQANQQLEQAQNAVEQAELQVEQANVQLQQAKDQTANQAVTAQASGELSTLNANVSDFVTNQQPFASIVGLNPMTVTASLTPEQLSLFKKGEELEVQVDSIDQKVTSTINYISSVPDDTGLYPVEATVPNDDENIKPGMMATFLLPEIVVESSLIVPTDAVVENGGEAYLYHVVDEKAVRVDVKILEAQTDKMAIEADLPKQAEVITSGQLTLTDGGQVSIMKEDA